MHKQCPCGQVMGLKLRTVIYSGKLEIDNVPIFSCDACQHSEVKASVKVELNELIQELGMLEQRKSIRFNELNEWADFLVEYKLQQKSNQTSVPLYESMLEERINDLLDLYLLAQQMNDQVWLESIRRKLEQLSSL